MQMASFPRHCTLTPSLHWPYVESVTGADDRVYVQVDGTGCAGEMRAIAKSRTARRVVGLYSNVHDPAGGASPVWDDFRAFATSCTACETVVLEGFGFVPSSASLAISQLHGVLALLVLQCSKMSSIVIEMPLLEDPHGGDTFRGFVQSITEEFLRSLAPRRWVYLWYEYRMDSSAVPLVRVSVEIREHSSVLASMLARHLRLQPPSNSFFGIRRGDPVVVLRGNDSAALQLTRRSDVKFHSSCFHSDQVHSQYNSFISRVISSDWGSRVGGLALHFDSEAILSFDMSARKQPRAQHSIVWWQDLIDAVGACSQCSSLCLTGDVRSLAPLNAVVRALRSLIATKTNKSSLGSVSLELTVTIDRDDDEDIEMSGDIGPWQFESHEGLHWEQGVVRITEDRWLVWACKAPPAKRCNQSASKRTCGDIEGLGVRSDTVRRRIASLCL